MSWVLDAIEREAEAQAAERMVETATVGIFPDGNNGWQIEVAFGEGMPFIRCKMENIINDIAHHYDDCVRSQVSELTQLIAAFRFTVARLESLLKQAQAEAAKQDPS
jgi:hypothetical protein